MRMHRTNIAAAGLCVACCAAPATSEEDGSSEATAAPTSGEASTSSTAETGQETSGTTLETSGTTGEVDGSPGCGAPGLAPGRYVDLALDVDGVARTYELYVPPGYDPEVPASLVLNFHGLLSTPAGQAAFSGFDASAAARGMLVAYPAGLGNSFNSGACCGQAYEDGVDDVGFARALVDELKATHCVDPRRVFVTGMSNGGHMAHLLACVAADVFAAAASVTGVLQLPPDECAPARPISMIDFHGTGDLVVPYAGKGPGYPDVLEMMTGWATRDECAASSVVTFEEGDMRCETWPGCEADVEVTLCTVDGGGHCWPGPGECPFGHNSQARDASEVIAEMFAAQPLP